jgi:hypothetical protein
VRFAVRARRVRGRVAVGAAGAVLLFAGLAVAPRESAAAATLTVLDPRVFARHGAAAYQPAVTGVALRAGDAVRTDATGRALVLYIDGSTVTLDRLSELEILSVDMSGRNLIVLMLQTAGRAWYVVQSALATNSRYEIRTPAAAAVVRAGSSVEVEVDANGATTFTAIDGEITATAQNERVALPRGSRARFSPPSSPAPTAGPSPTPTPEAGASPTASPTPTPSATPTPSPSGAPLPVPTEIPLPTATPAPLPTATPVPLPTATPTVPPIVPPIGTLPPLPGL